MQLAPMRSFDPAILQEPHIYRLSEAVMHYGEGLKAIINEQFGDGIMSGGWVDGVDGQGRRGWWMRAAATTARLWCTLAPLVAVTVSAPACMRETWPHPLSECCALFPRWCCSH